MIILPASTPAVAIDQNSINQSQQNQTNQSEQSRKATDTVMVSSEARQMASTAPATAQQSADIEVAEKVADREAAEQQRPVNPTTGKQETTKISVLA